ncbi:hypothetical protein FPV67DRAFT_1410472, partial [Lyophyllum atratum]
MPLTSEAHVDISDLAQKWTLNAEQNRAFKMITDQATEKTPKKPLILYIAGQAGTGKTRIIKAVKTFFDLRQQSRRFRLTSFMGMAARNISGVTIHASLAFGVGHRGK